MLTLLGQGEMRAANPAADNSPPETPRPRRTPGLGQRSHHVSAGMERLGLPNGCVALGRSQANPQRTAPQSHILLPAYGNSARCLAWLRSTTGPSVSLAGACDSHSDRRGSGAQHKLLGAPGRRAVSYSPRTPPGRDRTLGRPLAHNCVGSCRVAPRPTLAGNAMSSLGRTEMRQMAAGYGVRRSLRINRLMGRMSVSAKVTEP